MAIPSWDDPNLKAGTMVKCALWLIQEIGEGNTFTKERLRQAFPGVSQVDRRVRDLRAYQWVILTNTQDASLTAEDQRFVSRGVAVWDPSQRQSASPQKNFSAKEKQGVLARDGYMCTLCGVAGGDSYADDQHQTAVLLVSRRSTIYPGGRGETELVTECQRCKAGSMGEEARADEVLQSIEDLGDLDRQRIMKWISSERRGSTPLERAWNSFRRLPANARDEVRATLGL